MKGEFSYAAARVRKGAWRPDGLRLANDMRRENAHITKLELATAISQQVVGAPKNVEAIRTWLSAQEEAGDLIVHLGAKTHGLHERDR